MFWISWKGLSYRCVVLMSVWNLLALKVESKAHLQGCLLWWIKCWLLASFPFLFLAFFIFFLHSLFLFFSAHPTSTIIFFPPDSWVCFFPPPPPQTFVLLKKGEGLPHANSVSSGENIKIIDILYINGYLSSNVLDT